MPPIPQQQTSRAGLITALVISIMAALGFLVWAVMNNTEINKAEDTRKALVARYRDVVDEAAMASNPDIEALRSARQGNATLLDTAIRQRKSLAKVITGSEGSEAEAAAKAKTALDDAAALKDTAVPTESLEGAVKALTAKVKSDADVIAAAKKGAADAAAALAAEKQRHAAEIAKRDQQVKAEQDKANKAVTDSQAAIAEKQKQVDEYAKKEADATKTLGDAQQETLAKVQAVQAELDKQKKEYDKINSKLASMRPTVRNAMIRNSDATITQIGSDNTCYIDLGFGDHVMPGLTFEVYGRLEGVPKITEGTSNFEMPKGKASIEIIEVGQNSSRCRILVQRPGQQISQGDICANLVYDKNVKPVFFVYGDFDMDQNGVATTGEAEVIKNLITRWGGKVAEKLTVEVDYVIVGKEPVVPSFTQEELQQPINKQKFDDAKAKLQAFQDVLNLAANFHIPVMNQNRFLYYSGYFEASKK